MCKYTGQGLFTIIGLMLVIILEYSVEKKFIAIPTILKSINWLRKKSNKIKLIKGGNFFNIFDRLKVSELHQKLQAGFVLN